MVYSNDPDERERLRQAHQDERIKLADVIQYITEQRLQLKGQMPATAAHQETADELQRILQENADTLYSALAQPYFGRLDYFHTDETSSGTYQDSNKDGLQAPPRTIYLEITFIPGKDVFSWTAPVGRLWYTQSYEDGYTAPKGYIPTRVDLKRFIKIRERSLEYVKDIFRRQLPAPDLGRHNFLAEALSGTGGDDGHLQVIVETIEPEQYENIANVSDKVLIVQGAAGSGKSEIGLHRIAYLLSPFNDIAERERPTPDTTLFVGPSQAFLEYAADILPALGVLQGIHQVRFSEWLRNQLSERVIPRARIWSNLLDKGKVTRFNLAAETYKGSLAMADAIERNMRELKNTVEGRCKSLPPIDVHDSTIRVSSAQVSAIVDSLFRVETSNRPLNVRRADFAQRIAGIVRGTGQGQTQMEREELERRRREFMEGVINPWCDAAWPQIDFRREYASLLSDSEKMVRLSGKTLDPDDAEALAETVRRVDGNRFEDSDLGALAYLDHLLNGTIQSRYRHIVVDEAQDISPIEFKLLAASSVNNWFTVLGDTAQRLTPYRGVRGWREVERVFGRSDIARQAARTSYRSNKLITAFNNRILRTFDANIPAPKPFDRDGHRVEYSQYQNTTAMYVAVIADIERIRSMDGLEDAIVAILARDTRNMNNFINLCTSQGVSGIVRVGQKRLGGARAVLGRIPDVKGLEYDAVIVMGVNESFSDTVFNKKLLYLATTRAKHYLGIHWSGRQSPILKSLSDRGVMQYRS